MPATIERKSAKRVEIVDAEGWTHVVTKPAGVSKDSKSKGQKKEAKGAQQGDGQQGPRHDVRKKTHIVQDVLVPAELPDGLTLEQLEGTLREYQRRWKESKAWNCLRETLKDHCLREARILKVDKCVCVGLGSPSGLLRGGLVDRRNVSMYQLAALLSILEVLEFTTVSSSSGGSAICVAQDPVFNNLDSELLRSCNITAIPDGAFSMVDENTFLFAPGAERTHLAAMLHSNPALFFGGPLEDSLPFPYQGGNEENAVLESFVTKRRSIALPKFEPNVAAFWKAGLYWAPDDNRD